MTKKRSSVLSFYISVIIYFWDSRGSSVFCFEDMKSNITNSTEAPVIGFGCPELSDLENGNVTVVEYNSSHVLHFTCLAGYKLIGKSKIVCDGQEENETKPHCVRDVWQVGCGEPPMLADGEVRVEGWRKDGMEGEGLYAEGVRLEYLCMPGHHLIPPTTFSVCQQGRWSGVHPTCQPEGCLKPNALINGHFVPETDLNRYPENTHLHFSCDLGFQLQGVESVQCLPDSRWSHTLPQCLRLTQEEGISCVPPPLGAHVEVTVVRGLLSANVALSGTTLQLHCAAHHRDTVAPCAPALLRCVDGSWQGRLPNCVEVYTCASPLPIPHASVLRVGLQAGNDAPYSLGSQAVYSCESGYSLGSQAALFTCRPDGCWEPSMLPVCHPTPPPTPTHCYLNPGAWGDYMKLNTSLLVTLVAVASVSVILLSVCLVLVCRPHPSPHPPTTLGQPPADPDRVALIAFADGVQSVLPSYEEAVRGGVSVLNYRLHRPHWAQRRNRHPPSVRDSMGSTDTVTVSEASTNVTLDTVSSHSGSQTVSCHAACGSLTSETGSIHNTDGEPLLEVSELDESSLAAASSGLGKLQSDIASIHS